MSKNKFDLWAELEKLTKEEVIQLLRGQMSFCFHVRQRDLLSARAEVLRRKADAAFEAYISYPVPKLKESYDSPDDKFTDLIAWRDAHQQRERYFETYQKLWNKADKFDEEARNAR